MPKMIRRAERWIRALAYDAIVFRDGLHGWKPSRDAMLRSLAKDREVLASESADKLRAMVVHAHDTVPYYRDRWSALGLDPGASFSPKDLQGLAFLTKEIIKKDKAALVSTAFRRTELEVSQTGGTTGTQTSFYLDHDCAVARLGRRWAMHELCGYHPGMRRALVWGVDTDLPDSSLRGGIKRRVRKFVSGDEALCCTVMSAAGMLQYHERLLHFRPQVLYGYPSALAQFGRFLEDRGLEPIRVDTIITTAERLGSATRRQLTRLFGAEVFNLYATREYGCIGFECHRHNGFHIDSGSIFVEIVKDGRVLEAGEPGEIVITDLLNFGMPFIRSRTGDIGALAAEPCACGSPLPVLKGLDGRAADVVYRPDGSVVPGLMLIDVLWDVDSVRALQFAQRSIDRIDVRLVVTDSFSDSVRREVVRQVRGIMGEDIAIHVEVMNELERNPRSGKFPEVICTIDPHELPKASARLAQE